MSKTWQGIRPSDDREKRSKRFTARKSRDELARRNGWIHKEQHGGREMNCQEEKGRNPK